MTTGNMNGNACKKIWLINYYTMPPEFESRLRTIKFAQYLPAYGYEVKIFSSSFLHNLNINLIKENKTYVERSYGNLHFIHIKTKGYKKNGFMRIYSMIEFHIRLYFLRKKFEKPDLIIHIPAGPFGSILYFCAKKLNVPYIIDVLDLWPESFVSFGLVSNRNPLLKIAYRIEKWLYSRADKIIFSMEGGIDYIVNKKWDTANGGPIDVSKIYYINNGVDLHDFDTNKMLYILEDADLENKDVFKVIYLGSIRYANNLSRLINAAKILVPYKNIQFLIYGDGDERNYLESYCKKNTISNVTFKQRWIDPRYVPYVLSRSSLNILNYRQNDIWKYGGSQSKLFQYLASGKPICSNIEMGYCLINKFNLGIARQLKSDRDYAEAILSIFNLQMDAYNQMCERARKAAEDFDYRVLTKKLVNIL